MTPLEVAKSYDLLADIWNADSFARDHGIRQHEAAIAFSSRRRFALDVGCGSSGRLIDLLQSRGFEVEGIDISARMIELARRRHPKVPLHHADISEWPLPRRYDLISAWDSIWHLPLARQDPVMRKLCAGLDRGGVFIFTTGGLDAPFEKKDSAMGPPLLYSVLGIPATLGLLSEMGCICRHLEYDQYPEKHLYVIAQKNHEVL